MSQAPTLQAVITSRMARCLHSMRGALAMMQRDLDPLITGAPAASTASDFTLQTPNPSFPTCPQQNVPHCIACKRK